MNKKQSLFQIILFGIMLIFAFISIYPLIWVVIQSFKTETEFLSSIWTLPQNLRLKNYDYVWNTAGLSRSFMNSIWVTLTTTVLEIAFISLAGFAFAKLRFKFKKFFYYYIILNLLIPTPIILLPMFLMVRNLGIINTLPALMFPYFQGFAPLGLIITTNYFESIPDELMEAAKLDGCSIFRIFFSVMFPLAKPIAATMAILGSMQAWNEYIWALISITDTARYTLPVGVATLNDSTSVIGYTPVFAALSISSVVIVMIYLVLQKQFVKSIAAGAVKG